MEYHTTNLKPLCLAFLDVKKGSIQSSTRPCIRLDRTYFLE